MNKTDGQDGPFDENSFFSSLLNEPGIDNYGKDEGGDNIIVLQSRGGEFSVAQAICVALRAAKGDIDCEPVQDRYHPSVLIHDENDESGDAVVKTINTIFGSTRFDDVDFDDLRSGTGMTVERLLHQVGWEIGFSDEHSPCSSCFCIIHTAANSYSDGGRFRYTDDGELICYDCDCKNPDSYLEDYLDDIRAGQLRGFALPKPENFRQLGHPGVFMGRQVFDPLKFQNGLHRGMNANPKSQLKALQAADIDEVIFDIEPSQFYIEWTVWVPDDCFDDAMAVLDCGGDLDDKVGPAERAEAALKGLKLEPALPGHVAYTEVDPVTGTSTTKQIPNEQFIERGIK